jgi:hypothetical protein
MTVESEVESAAKHVQRYWRSDRAEADPDLRKKLNFNRQLPARPVQEHLRCWLVECNQSWSSRDIAVSDLTML